MIYTVTLNPSIDYIVRLNQVQVGSVNRMDSDDKFAGGKGINVSRVLKRLGIPNYQSRSVLQSHKPLAHQSGVSMQSNLCR